MIEDMKETGQAKYCAFASVVPLLLCLLASATGNLQQWRGVTLALVYIALLSGIVLIFLNGTFLIRSWRKQFWGKVTGHLVAVVVTGLTSGVIILGLLIGHGMQGLGK